jgi:hypothetical protein
VKNWRSAFSKKSFDLIEVFSRRFFEQPEPERLRTGRFDTVKQCICSTDLDPGRIGIGTYTCSRIDKIGVRFCLGPFDFL